MNRYVWTLFVAQVVVAANEAYYTKLRQSPQENQKCLILEKDTPCIFKGFKTSYADEFKIVIRPAVSVRNGKMLNGDDSKIIEIFARSLNVLDTYIDTICKTKEYIPSLSIHKRSTSDLLDREKIIDGGHQDNRIDMVFMGDGYTADERESFFKDIRRLTIDMFNGNTFRSYLPLFNIWAVYVESVEKGIGNDGPKDTPFMLYREAGRLREIIPGNAQNARRVCQLMGPGGCDFPAIIGNDDYYGGIGGEFIIATKSNRTGTMVLRHEMGHSFADVGEAYDNGYYYYGINTAESFSDVKTNWGHWLSSKIVREERAMYRLLEYPWADLNDGEQLFTFISDGQYNRWYLQVSVSAAGEADCLEFALDGVVLPWISRGSDDREFYDWYGDWFGFFAGKHTFSVRSKTPSTNVDIPRMICSVTLYELGREDQFISRNNYISAYPTWDVEKQLSYRPTNAGCLMRNMCHSEFCSVCKEGMWHQFLSRISLIDNVTVSEVQNPNKTKRVILSTLKLGHLRSPGNEVENERLEIRWFRGGQKRSEFNDQFEIDAQGGAWTVSVKLFTPEVRYDPNGLLKDTENFTVTLT